MKKIIKNEGKSLKNKIISNLNWIKIAENNEDKITQKRIKKAKKPQELNERKNR